MLDHIKLVYVSLAPMDHIASESERAHRIAYFSGKWSVARPQIVRREWGSEWQNGGGSVVERRSGREHVYLRPRRVTHRPPHYVRAR